MLKQSLLIRLFSFFWFFSGLWRRFLSYFAPLITDKVIVFSICLQNVYWFIYHLTLSSLLWLIDRGFTSRPIKTFTHFMEVVSSSGINNVLLNYERIILIDWTLLNNLILNKYSLMIWRPSMSWILSFWIKFWNCIMLCLNVKIYYLTEATVLYLDCLVEAILPFNGLS